MHVSAVFFQTELACKRSAELICKRSFEQKGYIVGHADTLTTGDYIQFFLASDPCKKVIMSWKEKLNIILSDQFDHDIIADHIRAMPYRDFLLTDYWDLIARKIRKARKYRCQQCYKAGYILHHVNYQRHGYEALHWERDLLLLCPSCHEAIHGNGKALNRAELDDNAMRRDVERSGGRHTSRTIGGDHG